MIKKKLILNSLIILIIAGGVSLYIWRDMQKRSYQDVDVKRGDIIDDSGEIDANNIPDETVRDNGFDMGTIQIEYDDSLVGDSRKIDALVPDLNRFIVAEGTKKEVIAKLKEIISGLKQDNGAFSLWLDLGVYRQSVGDYEGAKDAWEYASLLRPQNSLSFGNLSYIYGYYLKNPELSEKNILKAIENDPKMEYLYFQAYEIYRDVFQDKEKAKAFVKKTIEEQPQFAQNFQLILDELNNAK